MVKKILVGLLLVFSVFLISLLVTYAALVLNKIPPSIFKWLPDFTLGLFGVDVKSLKPKQYTALITIMTLVVGFLIAIMPIFGMWRKARKLRQKLQRTQQEFLEKQGIDVKAIEKKGQDDLVWMLQHYNKAEHITIFAGSFDWISMNKDIRQIIVGLAKQGNLKLVSRRTMPEIQRAFDQDKELYEILLKFKCFHDGSGLEGVTCTMIRELGTPSKFLYRSRSTEPKKAFNVCMMRRTEGNIELLHILAELTKAEHWGTLAGEESSTEEG